MHIRKKKTGGIRLIKQVGCMTFNGFHSNKQRKIFILLYEYDYVTITIVWQVP